MNLQNAYDYLDENYPNTSPKYRGDELDESEKQRIRNLIATSKSKLAKMSEIEKTELALRNSRLNPSIDWSL